jgi:hypothetical protein
MLVYGLENIVDWISSVIVLWRFYCPGEMTKQREDLLLKREKRASMGISIILALLGMGVIFTASFDLHHGPESAYDLATIYVMAFFSVFLFSFLTILKFHYGHRLQSASLYKDGICSLIGTTLSIALFINTILIDHFPGLWWLDPVVALLAGIFAFMYGIQTLMVASVYQGLPIFSLRWWMLSQGDGMDEMTGRDLKASDYGQTTMNSMIGGSSSDGTTMSEADLELTENNHNGSGPTKLSEVV